MEKLLTKHQAYAAMFRFLEDYYERTKSDDVGSLLGSMRLLNDSNPADPAIAIDWERAIKSSRDS